jgi:hypothetical protein
MKKVDGYDSATANYGGERERLPAGGYICKITRVEDFPDKQYLKIEFDIADGQYKGWYGDIFKRANFWGGNFIRSYKDSATVFFKGFITAVEESNPNYKWNWQEQTLVGKWIGLVLGYEEYENRNHEIKERIYVAQNRSGKAIKNGDFTVPELKRLKQASKPAAPGSAYDSMADMQETDVKMPWD